MSHPYHHACSSLKKFPHPLGWQYHFPLHHFLDSSKAHLADARHRSLFHHPCGILLAEKLGGTLANPLPPELARAIAEQHIREDIGYIAPLSQWVSKNPPSFLEFSLENWKKILHMPKPLLLEGFLARSHSAQNLKERKELLEILLLPETCEDLIGHPSRFLYFTSPGPFLCEQLLGPLLPSHTPTRTLCETLIKELFGHIPSLPEYLKQSSIKKWMFQNAKRLSEESLPHPQNS